MDLGVMAAYVCGFIDDLTASAAGIDGGRPSNRPVFQHPANDRDFAHLGQFSLRVDRRKCHGFRAERHPITRIFEIASSDHAAIGKQNSGPDAVSGIAGIGIGGGAPRGGDQISFACHETGITAERRSSRHVLRYRRQTGNWMPAT